MSDQEGPKWQRHPDGTTTLTVTSEGMTGKLWVNCLETAGFELSENAKDVLRAERPVPSNGVKLQITVIPGTQFADPDRTQKKALKRAISLGLQRPEPEAACFLRELPPMQDDKISQQLIIMHPPVKDSNGHPRLLGVNRDPRSNRVYTYLDEPNQERPRHIGFVFVKIIT